MDTNTVGTKHRRFSLALTFLLGVIAGVVGVGIYQVWGKPAMPKVTKSTEDEGVFVIGGFTKYIFDPPIKTELTVSLTDTQPIKVSDCG